MVDREIERKRKSDIKRDRERERRREFYQEHNAKRFISLMMMSSRPVSTSVPL